MVITFINVSNDCTLDISVPLIIGNVVGCAESIIYVQNTTIKSETTAWPVINGKFKVLVELHEGENKLQFCHNRTSSFLTLYYQPIRRKRFIRLVYIKCKDDEGKFQAPCEEDSSIESACKRICLAARMLQTFTYEKIAENGLKKKTFRLEEENGNVKCHIFTSCLSLDEAYKKNGEELWSHFAIEIMNSKLRVHNDCKFLAFLSFTRYMCDGLPPRNHSEVLNLTKGQVALGGGGLALFGTGCLHTWPQNIQEVPWRFGDNRKVDRTKFMDDSGNRGRKWACYSTCLGATLHELGHTFDLGHTTGGIMGRGFDDIYKYFIVDMFYFSHLFQKKYNPYYQESTTYHDSFCTFKVSPNEASKQIQSLQIINGDVQGRPMCVPNPPDESSVHALDIGKAYWLRSSALILYFHKWFNNVDTEDNHSLLIEKSEIKSPHGVRVVEFRDEAGNAFHHLEFLDGNGEREVGLTKYSIQKTLPKGVRQIILVAEDSLGNIRKVNLEVGKFLSFSF